MFKRIRAKKKTENLNQINRINMVRASQGNEDISNSKWQESESRYKFGHRRSEVSILGRAGAGAGIKGSAKNLGIKSPQTTGFATNSSKKNSKISQTGFNKPGGVKPIIGF